MTGLNENHKHRILVSLQEADRLLGENSRIAAPASESLFSHYVQDVTSAESHWVRSYEDKIREQMLKLMRRFELRPQSASVPSSWGLRVNMISLDIVLEDLYPDQMKGYGEIDTESARELTWTIHEIRRLVTYIRSSQS